MIYFILCNFIVKVNGLNTRKKEKHIDFFISKIFSTFAVQKRNADMAQLVEHFIRNERVRGSSPRVGSKGKIKHSDNKCFIFPFFILKLID